MKYFLPIAATLLAASPAFAQATQAIAPENYVNICESAPYTEFDFWVGDWVAFDYETGVVQGVDRIEKVSGGCGLRQDWIQLTDRYRTPGAPNRYFGVSLSAPLSGPDGGWQQVWVNEGGGGAITLRGGLNEEGTMVIRTDERQAQDGRFFRQVWYWDPADDGTIHSWGEIEIRQPDDTEYSETIIPWNLTYMPRADSPNLVAAPREEG
ncbi:MAG: hypothetical protein DHS20C06_02590 [Hyphobacterium sp.]|nr:MAG: hypothetical protein DHS20C06_02590 [Hyphobacterium sp.]